jgi:hypothetical protein
LKRALEDISKVVNYCNEKIRDYENTQSLIYLQKKYDLIVIILFLKKQSDNQSKKIGQGNEE